MRVSGRIIAVALLLVGFAVSCGQLLGEVEVEKPLSQTTGHEKGPPDAGPPPPPVICELGTTQCDGRLLQLCTDGGTAWATLQACATAALCNGSGNATVSACIAPKCADQQMSCDGNVLQLCNADRTGWELFDTCKTAAHCDAGQRQCLPAPCNPGDRRCNVGNLEKCNDAQTDWEQLDTCVTNELCEATLTGTTPGLVDGNLTTNTSAPGAAPAGGGAAPAAMSGAAMSAAAPSGAGGSGGTAGAPAGSTTGTTTGGAANAPTQCLPPVCLPKEVRCTGLRLEACNDAQTDFELAEECATAALCDASITYTGLRGSPRCVRPTCSDGQHQCTDDGVLGVCNADRDGYDTVEECIGPPFCNSVAADNGGSGCEDAPCEAGQRQCNGPQIQVCSDDRTHFDVDPNGLCETRDLCNDSDPNNVRCDQPTCRRGALSGNEFRCQGATLQRCNDQETGYDNINSCASAGLCNAGLGFNGCQPPKCQPGQTRCNGDFVQVCSGDLTGFVNQELCAAGTCDSQAGRCADPCIVGSARCNSQGQLEVCRDKLVGRQVTALCLSPQLCDANAQTCHQPPAGCTADGVRQCVRQGNSTALQQCADGRSHFITLDTCTGSEICDPNNSACDVCDPSTGPTCQGNTLVTCSPDGQNVSSQNCPNGCETVQNGPDRCRSCVLAAASCDGSQLAVCVARGATDEFIERRPCDSAALCQQALATCNSGRTGQDCRCQPGVCAPGDRDCQGAQPVVCNSDRTALVANGAGCGSTLNCNPKPVGACFPCAPGDVRCGSDGTMQGCLSDRSGFANLPGAIPGQVRCISSNGGVSSQGCSGSQLVTQPCSSGICNADGSGCAECDPNSFKSTCATDGSVARSECIGGKIDERACDVGSNPCSQAACNGGACNTASRGRGAACTRANGAAGFCDGLANTPSCVECTSDAQCADDGNPCTTESCSVNGACLHSATSGNACTQSTGAPGICVSGTCSTVCTANQGQCSASGAFTRCNAQGTAFNPLQQCASAALCNVNSGCGMPCDPSQCGSVGCKSDLTGCNACNPTTSCPQPGACQVAVCGGSNGLTCGTQALSCPQGQSCDPQTGQCAAQCDPTRCGTVGCRDTRSCNTCQVGVNCNPGTCQTASCSDALTCTLSPLVCQQGQSCNPQTGQCEAQQQCAPNQGSCNGVTFTQCNPQGTGFNAPQQCASAALCSPSQGCGTPCQDSQCGDVRCRADLTGCNTCNPATSCPQPANCLQAICNGLTCGTQPVQCPNGQDCNPANGNCEAQPPPPPAPFCGDGTCNGAESSANCPMDCGAPTPPPAMDPPPPPAAVCGDGVCDASESILSCPVDCLLSVLPTRLR